MKQVISAKDVEELLRRNEDLQSLPADAILTPSARDLVRDFEGPRGRVASAAGQNVVAPGGGGTDLERIFNSAQSQALKEEICEIGRRLWHRAYVDGNGGNISVRVGENIAICTPTLVSKGFMKPEDLCLVDLEGKQLLGRKKRTSEILMHLQIMKAQPKAKAVVHCHPPHATAFAVAGVEPPTCMIPEIEVFIGKVPLAPYETPGTMEMGRKVAELVDRHNTVLMANHGVVAWSHSVEDAYFKMEIIEAYCRTIVVASQLGTKLKTFTPTHLQDLLKIKQQLDIPDPRIGLRECELCDNNEWRPGVVCQVPAPQTHGGANGSAAPDPQAEALVQKITEELLAAQKRG